MSRVLYFDCFSGIAGDMVLGACLDAGLPFDELKAALGSLAMGGYDVSARRVLRCGVSATKFDVFDVAHLPVEEVAPAHPGHERPVPGHAPAHGSESDRQGHTRAQPHEHSHEPLHSHGHAEGQAGAHTHPHAHPPNASHGRDHGHRSLAEICALVDGSALSASGKARAQELFHRLAAAEAAIHDMPIERVHLHEVGAVDSVIDVVGAVFALEWIDADRIVCSPLNVGGGMVRSAHGVFPVPAPATLRLLADAPIYAGAVQKELVTPTGALLATGYATSFGPVPAMSVERVGYGAGSRDNPETPNVLRILVGQATESVTADRVVVLECEIDDMNPQLFGVVMDRLYAAGALDVGYLPVQMKKNRPGTRLTVVAPPALRADLSAIIFNETTTIGLRHHEVERECLSREMVAVDTPLGPVRFKLASRDGRVVNAAPEFEDCARLAAAHGRTVKDVQALAIQSYGMSGSAKGQRL
jgi:pyridinium-3,5-bisthiocarboxylic acid mononucleotide nickel chelatase